MNIESILRQHEQSDGDESKDVALLERAMREQLENAEDVIALMREHKGSAKLFFEGGTDALPFAVPFLPVRKCEKFGIRKHTMCQRPYMHGHTFYELIFVGDGSCTQYSESGEPVVLTKGQAVLLSPGCVHSLGRCGLKDRILKLTVPRELFGRIVPDGFSLADGKTTLFDRLTERAEYLIYWLLDETSAGGDDRTTESLLQLLFNELLRRRDVYENAFTDMLREYFREHIDSASLSDFAYRTGYSEGYLSRRIRESGSSFSDKLTEYRMEAASEKLKSGGCTVEEIASSLGYTSVSGFYRQFRRRFGITPAAYGKTFG